MVEQAEGFVNINTQILVETGFSPLSMGQKSVLCEVDLIQACCVTGHCYRFLFLVCSPSSLHFTTIEGNTCPSLQLHRDLSAAARDLSPLTPVSKSSLYRSLVLL